MIRDISKQSIGFTLVELLTTLSIIAILIAAGIPSLNELNHQLRARNAYHHLINLIQFTRLQSVSYRAQVLLCPTANQIDCINDWNQPLMIFVDLNMDETRNNDEIILRVSQWIEDNERLTWRASGSRRYLRFKSDGTTRNQNGRLTYCLRRGSHVYAKQIVMTMAGRARRGSEAEARERC